MRQRPLALNTYICFRTRISVVSAGYQSHRVCSPLPLSEGRGVAPIRKQRTAPSARHAHLFSKGKITFQSFFMLMTFQPFLNVNRR